MAAAATAEFWKHWEGRSIEDGLTLGKCLGGNAGSAVFLTGNQAAVRLVRANPSTAEPQLARWQKASRLSHPNLLRLLKYGRCRIEDTAMLYVVMELADENLSQVVPERALTASETRETLVPVLDALRYIHHQGFVHGRIKPANIMAAGDQVKLSGDSLSRPAESGERPPVPGRYDAPESVVTGPTPAGDVWSLGVTLTEVLTQRVPEWTGPGQNTLVLPENFPGSFTEIVRHCLQRDPKGRWTVDEIAAVLAGGAAPAPRSAPLAAAPSRVLSPEPKPSPKWRMIVPVAAVALLAIVFLWNRGGSAPAAPADAPKAAATQPQAVPPQPAAPEPAAEKTSTPAPPPAKPKPETKARKEEAPRSTAPQIPPASGDIMVQVMPKVASRSLNNVRGHFSVVVRVQVNSAGNVIGAKYEERSRSRYFAEKTLAAAKEWHFRPADTPQEWTLRFEYSKGSMKVVPTRSQN